VTEPLGTATGARTRLPRLALAVGLLVLAPVGAEYLIGYDTSTGHPLVLLGDLVIFVPLYGAPALLVRELAVRAGVRWPGILLLTAALGLLQAGVIDQSMFNSSYRDIDYWDEMVLPTLVAPLGISGYTTLTFIVGHQLWSYGIPIALTQSLSPGWAGRPWLRASGLVTCAVLYLAAAALVWRDTVRTESDLASDSKLAAALAVTALLVVLALTLGRRPARPGTLPAPRRTAGTAGSPAPWLPAAVGLGGGLVVNLAPTSWTGVLAMVAVLVGAAGVVTHWSRATGWSGRHVVALATGALVARAAAGFLVVPLGDVDPTAKYLHNVFFTVASLALGCWAYRRNRTVTPTWAPAVSGRPRG
jgi:hypothetical protein